MGRHLSPQKCPFPWGIWTPSNIWFLGPIGVHNPIGSAVFVGLTIESDRPTDRPRDHATPSVTIGRISVRSSLPFHQIDIIGAMVIVWRVSAKIIRSVLCSVVCNNNCEQRNVHTYEQA